MSNERESLSEAFFMEAQMTKKRILLSALVLLLMSACSDPQPRTNQEWYLSKLKPAAEQKYWSAMAGPDYRYRTGEIKNTQNALIGEDKLYYSSGKTLVEAEKNAVAYCEKLIGENECYIHFSHLDYVRLAQRKKWLKQNPSQRREIAQEKRDYKEERALAVARAPVIAPASNQKSDVDYDQAAELFRIAQEALNSTLPKAAPMPKVCTNTWTVSGWQSICH